MSEKEFNVEKEFNAEKATERKKIKVTEVDLTQISCNTCGNSPRDFILTSSNGRDFCSECLFRAMMKRIYEAKKRKSKKSKGRDEK